MRKVLLNTTIIIAIVISFGVAGFAQRPLLGGYSSAATDNAEVVAAAEYAVEARAENNPEQEGLALESVDKAEKQVVSGVNYRLCLTVSLDDESQQVKVIVNQNLQKEYSLKSWAVEDCGESSSYKTNAKDEIVPRYTMAFSSSKVTVVNCTGEQLSVKEIESEADMGGKRWQTFVFTNISSKTCRLLGFPRFSLLNKSGKVMSRVAVKYDNDFIGAETNGKKPVSVLLKPKATAFFQIFYNDGMALENVKQPVPASAKVRVKAPNTTREFVIKSEVAACCGVQVSSIRGGLPQ